MEVLSTKFPGIFFICEQCGALCANVQENEIYENCYVYCPVCKTKNLLPLDKAYDGIIKGDNPNVTVINSSN